MRLNLLSAAAAVGFSASLAWADPAPPPPQQSPAAPARSLTEAMPAGVRAFSIVTDGLSGAVPGDRVDVIFVHNVPQDVKANEKTSAELTESLRPALSEVLLTNAEVLQVQGGVPAAVTLQVTQMQAQQLGLAQKLGSLFVALRPVADKDRSDVPAPTQVGELTRMSTSQNAPKEEVKIVRGSAGSNK